MPTCLWPPGPGRTAASAASTKVRGLAAAVGTWIVLGNAAVGLGTVDTAGAAAAAAAVALAESQSDAAPLAALVLVPVVVVGALVCAAAGAAVSEVGAGTAAFAAAEAEPAAAAAVDDYRSDLMEQQTIVPSAAGQSSLGMTSRVPKVRLWVHAKQKGYQANLPLQHRPGNVPMAVVGSAAAIVAQAASVVDC